MIKNRASSDARFFIARMNSKPNVGFKEQQLKMKKLDMQAGWCRDNEG